MVRGKGDYAMCQSPKWTGFSMPNPTVEKWVPAVVFDKSSGYPMGPAFFTSRENVTAYLGQRITPAPVEVIELGIDLPLNEYVSRTFGVLGAYMRRMVDEDFHPAKLAKIMPVFVDPEDFAIGNNERIRVNEVFYSFSLFLKRCHPELLKKQLLLRRRRITSGRSAMPRHMSFM